ncbi:putative glycosyltransferase [Thermus thermophilus HB8]|uniref:Glycosyltransferase n=1 Tax=Thermus thermophilus (strain ATCC 27634 / DSM 579 / HB8) TaxID=300852 RepID=Q5SJA5_THET8|nr:putative glycosyltransferase [Thermus thermophilus HB8]
MRREELRLGLVAYPGLGGSGTVAAELADRLARMGHRVYLFATSRPFRLPEASPAVHVPVDLPYYPVFPGPLYTLSLAGTLEREAKRLGLDLVHTHYAVPHAAAAYLAFGEGLPLVHTLHGTDVSVVGMDPAFHGPTRRALEAARAVTAVSRAWPRKPSGPSGWRRWWSPTPWTRSASALDLSASGSTPRRGSGSSCTPPTSAPSSGCPTSSGPSPKSGSAFPPGSSSWAPAPRRRRPDGWRRSSASPPGSPSTPPPPTRRRSWGRRTSSFWPRRRSPSARRPSRPWPPASPWWPRRWAGWPRWSPPRWAGSWSSATWRPWRRPPWTSWEAPASPR